MTLLRARCEKCGGQRILERDDDARETDDRCIQCGRLAGSYVREGTSKDVVYVKPGQGHSEDARQVVLDLLEGLPAREKALMQLRLGVGIADQPHTLADIGDLLNISKSRACQLQQKAFNHLEQQLNAESLQMVRNH